jgi:large subunit ribosomal protein L5e
MGFVKVIKNKAYFKRFQPKYRRRREGKTDYRARRRLIAQDKTKYNTPKYRLVARISNKDITCQIISSRIQGDMVLCSAYSHELKRYGMPVGLTNYAAAYATGLLLARRVMLQLKLADKYKGNTKVDGTDYHVEALAEGPAPFRALLDVGLSRTSTGSKQFAVLKGACDGGMDIPHSETRFVGYDVEGKKLDAEVLRKYIFGGHVSGYMKSLKESDSSAYEARFSKYIKAGLTAETMEKTWAKVHAAIRADPSPSKKLTKEERQKKVKKYNKSKRSLAQRKDRIRQILANKAKQGEKATA